VKVKTEQIADLSMSAEDFDKTMRKALSAVPTEEVRNTKPPGRKKRKAGTKK